MRDRNTPLTAADAGALAWEKMGGLIPAVAQDRASGQILMLAYMNRDALNETLATGRAVYFSRSRGELWRKGETSGAFLENAEVFVDCDGDALLLLVDPAGPACHLGTPSCFTAEIAPGIGFLAALESVIDARAASDDPESYVRRLFAKGPKGAAQKVGEEGVETALAGAAEDDAALIDESADLVFHLLVLLRARGLRLSDVAARLRARHRPR